METWTYLNSDHSSFWFLWDSKGKFPLAVVAFCVIPSTGDFRGIRSPVDFDFTQGVSEHFIHKQWISVVLCGSGNTQACLNWNLLPFLWADHNFTNYPREAGTQWWFLQCCGHLKLFRVIWLLTSPLPCVWETSITSINPMMTYWRSCKTQCIIDNNTCAMWYTFLVNYCYLIYLHNLG